MLTTAARHLYLTLSGEFDALSISVLQLPHMPPMGPARKESRAVTNVHTTLLPFLEYFVQKNQDRMKKHIAILVCLVFTVVFLSVPVAAQISNGLTLTCQVSSTPITPAPNSPIWLDLTVTNVTTTTFSGQYSVIVDVGAVATTSPVMASLIQKASYRTVEDVTSVPFTIDPGKTKVFPVLLNDLISPVNPGSLSGWIVLPLFDEATHQDVRFVLVTPLIVQVGEPLARNQLSTVSALILTSVESYNFGTRYDAVRSLGPLPDANAVQVLVQAIKERQSSPWVGDLLDALGRRPRTPASTKALTDIAQSDNPELSALAAGYLKK